MHQLNRLAIAASATRVLSVADFCKEYKIAKPEEAKLLRLFGRYATECELRYNVTREPRVH